MDIITAINLRHSVRTYLDKEIEEHILEKLEEEIKICNIESGLHIQLITNEPKAFDSFMAHYGKFSGVKNYIALIGKKTKKLDELCGYYGERLVLLAQQLGLNSCFVAMTYKKIPSAFVIDKNEKLRIVIAIGYGKTDGASHKIKPIEKVCNYSSDLPEWFINGVNMALLAPTAMNQQKFKFIYDNGKVLTKPGVGFYSKIDLGIAKYHFEIGSNRKL